MKTNGMVIKTDKDGARDEDENEDDDDVGDEEEDEDEDKDEDGVGDGKEDEDDDRERDRNEDEASGEEIIPSKRPRMGGDVVGEKAKVLYDEETKNEKWWTGLAVDKVNEETYRLYFPDDQEVAEVSREEFKVIEKEHDSPIGKQVVAAYKAKNGRKEFSKGVIVNISPETQYRVFFPASQEIDEISRKLIASFARET